MNSWHETVRHYSSLDEQGRQLYWRSLTAEQQAALTDALNSSTVTPTDLPGHATSHPIKKHGVLSTTMIGCTGFILGIVLTIGAQILAVYAGVQGVKNFVNNAIEEHAAEAEAWRLDCDNPRDGFERMACTHQAKEEDARLRESWGED